jgi:hypothetical protein
MTPASQDMLIIPLKGVSWRFENSFLFSKRALNIPLAVLYVACDVKFGQISFEALFSVLA